MIFITIELKVYSQGKCKLNSSEHYTNPKSPIPGSSAKEGPLYSMEGDESVTTPFNWTTHSTHLRIRLSVSASK